MDLLKNDSPLMIGISHLVDYMWLGLLWAIASLHVITFGAATTAMLITAELSIKNDGGKVFTTFWTRFRREFKEATILWLIQVPLLIVVAVNIWVTYLFQFSTVISVLVYAVSAGVFCWLQLWFGYLSKFEDNVRCVLKNTLYIALGKLVYALLLGVLAVAALIALVLLPVLMPPLVLLIPGIYIIFCTAIQRKIFSPFIPHNDISSAEGSEE